MSRKQPANPWYGSLPDCCGGYDVVVIADTEDHAKDALLKAWQNYDRESGSTYHGQVKTFEDLADIYGAFVKCLPWNQWVYEKV